jgi:hypothetical protein
MAHFAKVNDNNIVEEVIVVDNKNAGTEQQGKDFIASLGLEGNWVQTSYNRKFRNAFASVGDIYDLENDMFVYDENKELEDFRYLTSWQGVMEPTTPSILFDAPPRCANIWTISFINQAFPNIFQRWGYLKPHSYLSFGPAVEKFNVIATTLRMPIDSLASQIVMFETDTNNNRELNNLIQSHIDMLQSTLDNKNNVTIFTFETATQNPEKVISVLSNMLKLEAQPFNKDTVFNKLNEAIALTETYNVPIDNKDELDAAKATLNQERFADLIAKANELYTKLLVFVEA